ncbi:MAG: ATP-binding protein [Candidatus Nanopelagicales bacterium]
MSVQMNPGLDRRRVRRWGIATQTMVLVIAIAMIAVLVAGVASFPFVRAAAEAQSVGKLASLADITAAYADRRAPRREELLPRPLAQVLGREQITGYVIERGADPPEEISRDLVEAVLSGESVSARADASRGSTFLIEGRPIDAGALFLIQPLTAVSAVTASFVIRIVAALVLGLIIAVGIAYVVSRRLSRPLRAAQQAALRMASGSREEQLPVAGPLEVADIAEALNVLNAALATSEGRQREFLLSVSHELRTPLTAIKGYGEALADGLVPAEDAAHVGGTVAAEATRLNRLVNDLLDLARMGAVDFRIATARIDVSEVVDDAARVWTDRCTREGVRFATVGTETPTPVVADAMRVRQILDNLLENALRVSPRDSAITVVIHHDPQVAGPEYTAIEVRDAGPGLSSEDLAVAFDPGALHERYRGIRPVGTGLGLALVARLAAAMGGSSTVTSAPGEGSSFWVRLPRAST